MLTLYPTATKIVHVYDHAKDRAYNKQGFGSKIPTDTMVQVQGSNRWYRVYSRCVANYDPNHVHNYDFICRKGRDVRIEI